MSKTNKIFSSIPVQIPDRSGFDLSHEVLTTAKTGAVVPVSHFEVLPGDTISMGSMMKVTLPPFAVPFMGRIDAELTAAFIPYRLLWQGWQAFITANNGTNAAGNTPPLRYDDAGNIVATGNQSNVPQRVPCVNAFENLDGAQTYDGHPFVGPGSLMNYLGVKRAPGGSYTGTYSISAMPFLAYQKFCDDWIRDENNIKPYFPKVVGQFNWWSPGERYDGSIPSPNTPRYARYLPYISNGAFGSDARDFNVDSAPISLAPEFANDREPDVYRNLPYNPQIGLGSLRQRCWAKDYFTTATTRPQAGAQSEVIFDTSGDTGGFTIQSLRQANALQKWLERNNIAGTEYGSQILAHFGVTPPDAVLNRSILLGSVRTPVMVSSVANTNGNTNEGQTYAGKNPYGSALGSAAGFGSGLDKGSLVDNFTAKEHGIIMVFFSLIPHAYYNTGIERDLLHRYLGDFAWPEFAGVGDQPIRAIELSTDPDVAPNLTWGYQQRYVEYKHKLDKITGLLSDGNSLAPYALQRGFAVSPELGREFLEIPTDYLDQVTGVTSELSGFGCMVDVFFDCKALRVLPEYSLPHL